MQAFWYFRRKSGAKPYKICHKSGANTILCDLKLTSTEKGVSYGLWLRFLFLL